MRKLGLDVRLQKVTVPHWVRGEEKGELIEWMRPLTPGLKKVFLVHGDPGQGAALSNRIHKEFGIEAVQPSRGDSFDLK